MKRYKLKVDSPWGKKGDIANLNENGVMYYGQNTNVKPYPIISGFTPDNFPDIFEEIIEPSDEEWLSEWLLGIVRRSGLYDIYTNISSELIANGFDVKKLREKSEKEENT